MKKFSAYITFMIVFILMIAATPGNICGMMKAPTHHGNKSKVLKLVDINAELEIHPMFLLTPIF